MNLQLVGAPLDGRWWDAAAARLLEFADGCRLPARDLRALTVLVPRISDAPWLRGALHRARGGGTLVTPSITTLERWVGAPAGLQTQRLVELFEALRASAWATDAFGDRPGALWSLASELARLGDELTLAAVGRDQAFEGAWRDSVTRHFRRRAAVAASDQAQLVLHLWRAHCSGQFGAGALLRNWARRLEKLDGPLAVLAPFGLADWQRALLTQGSIAHSICAVSGDLMAAASTHGWLPLAWPELAAAEQGAAAIGVRCEAARAERPPSLRILSTRSLEEEAGAAATEVERWLRSGVERIALVALDRLTARRVRALLERAGILVADQAGWKLSTTSAAAAVMRWVELAGADFRTRDLLDWLRSPFVLYGRPERLTVARLIDRAARGGLVAGGVRALEQALARLDEPGPDPEAARAMLPRLAEQGRLLQGADTLDRLGAALDVSLDALGMREALARDPVGRDVLRELARIRFDVAGSGVRMSPAAFRELLAHHFESTNASDPGADSPVVMTSLVGACLRGFEAAIVIGADAEHLPSGTEPGVLMSSAVRRDLGLATAADLHRAQAVELATLLCCVPQVVATWRLREGDEPRALSPWLDRLRVMAEQAGWPAPVTVFDPTRRMVEARAAQRPAPQAPHRLPARLSVGACQSLVDCPYQFYARHLLGLGRRSRVANAPDKRDLGNALHRVLHRLHREVDAERLRQMPDPQVQQELERITHELFGRDLRERPALIGYRRRLLDLIPAYVRWLRARTRGGWRLQAAEAGFQVPMRIDASRAIELSGRIDRIDAHGQAGRNAIDPAAIDLEVIDYKARSHELVRKSAADPGEDIQLPLYALAPGAGEVVAASYLSFERSNGPHGPYSSVEQVAVAGSLDRWVRRVEQRLRDDLGRIAGGSPLAAIGVEPTCSRCEMRGLCRRGEWGDR